MTADPSRTSGAVTFYDDLVPALAAGDYLLNVTQQVESAAAAIDECFAAAQAFSVDAPRWSLPVADVFAVHPPNEAVGPFDQDLPHVVLTAPELPWERDVFGEDGTTPRTPWLALLVLEPGELLVEGDDAKANRTRSTAIPVAQLFDPRAGGKTLWPKGLTPRWYEADAIQTQTCTVIEIATATFASLLPDARSLHYRTHVRRVDATAKDSALPGAAGERWFSVVVANRLPAVDADEAKRSIVHLVSLEGLAGAVADHGELAGYDRVRLVSLQSWTFTCAAEGRESFAQLVAGLDRDAAMAIGATPASDAGPEEERAAGMLGRGFVPLPWRTRQGEQTWGWYRGPFSPEPVADAGWRPFGTASAAFVYDSTWGTFDLSYAVAWETGRLLALADGAFSRELLDWRRRGHALVDLIAERMAQAKALSTLELDDAPTEEQVLELIRPYAVTDDFMGALVDRFGSLLSRPDDQPADPPSAPYRTVPAPPADPQTLGDLMRQPGIQDAIRGLGGAQLGAIADWLAQRYALMGVPFEALVPRAALLPAESIRFAYVDANWLDALLEGALSVGMESSRDVVYADLMKRLIWDTTLDAVGELRGRLLGTGANAGAVQGMAAMLLRSALVSGWPGLEVRAYGDALGADGRPVPESEIPLLRMERLAGDVLLCLWPRVPAVVAVDEPREGIAFGFQDAPTGQGGRLWLYPRSIADPTYGQRAGDPVDAQSRVGADRVLDVVGLIGDLPALGSRPAVRDFVTQMIRVPEQGLFTS